MPSNQVNRVTLFKIPDPKAQEELLSLYKDMKAKALKDGKPYILNCEAGHTGDDARNQGYNIVAKTTFADLEGFEYYDKECAAHRSLRAFAQTVHQGSMMVYFQSAI